MKRKLKSDTRSFEIVADKMMFSPQAIPYYGSCPGGKFQYINTFPEALEVLSRRQKLPIAVDIETSGLDPFTDCIHLMSIAFTNMEAVVLDIRQLIYDSPDIWVNISWFLLENKFVIHNSSFEQVFFRHYFGCFANVVADTQVMNEIASAGLPERSGLGEVTKHYLEVEVDKTWQKGFADLHRASPYPEEAVEYAAGDVTRLLQLSYMIENRLKKQGLWHIWDEVERPLLEVVAEAKYRGVSIEPKVLETLRQNLLYQLAGYGSDFSRSYPELNINSSQQITELLANLGNKVENADEEVLQCVIEKGNIASKKVASTVLGYRGVKKLLSTYVEPLLGKNLNPVTGKVHASWRQCGTDTGRMACREPNLQNIPASGEGSKIREAFIADPGNAFVIADYSNFELRVLASLSKEPAFVNAFKSGEDLHGTTAAMLFGKEFTKDQRKLAKIFNFALAYGAGPPALAQQCGISIKLAMNLYDAYFKAYPTLAAYLKRSAQYAKDYNESSSPLGRKRYYTRPNPDDEGYRWRMEAIGRAGVNHPIQSCNGDSIKIASIAIHRRLREVDPTAYIALWVHDETVTCCAEDKAELIAGIVEQEMVNAAVRFITEVPVEVVVNISDKWIK